jgi:hypothetical protein
METATVHNEITPDQVKEIRQLILNTEEVMKNTEGAIIGDSEELPLVHSFADGIYVRQITIPAGMLVVGRIHKHEHPNVLLKGEVLVVTEFGEERLTAPRSMISKAGTKRALYTITETVWITYHHNPTNTQDIEELDRLVIANSYEEYERFIAAKENKVLTEKIEA